jgi:hypothetical protein
MPLYKNTTPIFDAVADGLAFTPTNNKTMTAFAHRSNEHFLEIDGQILWTGTGVAGSVTIDISQMTGSPVINTDLLPGGTSNTNAGQSLLGYAQIWSQGGSTWTVFHPVYYSTTGIQFVSGGLRLAGNTYASGSTLNYHIRIPIVGW